MARTPIRHVALVLALALGLLGLAAPAPAGATGATEATGATGGGRHLRPVIFVHGGAGSGAQFESQAMRFTSNGYPASHIAVHEYDSTFGLNTMEQVWAGLDVLIADLLADTGADRVDLLGHSLGTAVSHGYLTSSPERAARIAHYVNIDGRTATAEPGGVETLAVWGEGSPARQIVGAENYYAPDQAHVQVATSAETFAEVYAFFTGRAPRTTEVLPERSGRLRISGRASIFPANIGADGETLQIWEVDGRSGARRGRRPEATYLIGPDGDWGPFRAVRGRHYEFALAKDTGSTHHFYYEPFVRSDHLVRLLTSEPGTGIDLLREKAPGHASVSLTRYKEWWGDQPADVGNDALVVDGTRVLNAANAPRTKRVNAMFLFDAGVDRTTDLTAPLPAFFALPFITGMDVYLPATSPPRDPIRISVAPRTAPGSRVTVNVPNWPSTDHHSTVQLWDFDPQGRGGHHR